LLSPDLKLPRRLSQGRKRTKAERAVLLFPLAFSLFFLIWPLFNVLKASISVHKKETAHLRLILTYFGPPPQAPRRNEFSERTYRGAFMARIIRQSKPRGEGSTRVQFSELIIFAVMGITLLAGIRYYFFVYKASAGYALGAYLNAVNHGDVDTQYEMIDEAEKRKNFPTKREYENLVPLAHGYTERITGWQPTKTREIGNDKYEVDVTIDLRGLASGKELYQTGGTDSVKDYYVMKKDGSGDWRIIYSESRRQLVTIKPNDKSNF
jgi:hypothetical protein